MFAKPFVWLIDFYRYFISPLFPRTCRFHPSCSAYAREALLMHGLYKGFCLILIRLLKCHPLHPGGLDPVPANKNQES